MISRITILGVIFVCCFLGAICLHISDFSLLNAMLWNLLALIAGVAIASSTFFLSVVGSIRENVLTSLREHNADNLTIDSVNRRFSKGVGEMRGNVRLILMISGSAVALVFWGHANIPYVAWPIEWISKLQTIYGLSAFLLFLALLATWDIVDMMFLLRRLGDEESGRAQQKFHQTNLNRDAG
jgi:hypothetical protein